MRWPFTRPKFYEMGTGLDQFLGYVKGLPEPPGASEQLMLWQRMQAGDDAAGERLLEAQLKGVVKEAKRKRNGPLPLSDLVSIGSLTAWHALKLYDPSEGTRIHTYVCDAVQKELWRALEKETVCTVTETVRKRARDGDYNDLERHLAFALQQQSGPLRARINGEEREYPLPSNADDPEAYTIRMQLAERARAGLERLSDVQRYVITSVCYHDQSLRALGKELGATASDIQRVFTRGLAALREGTAASAR